MYSVYTASSVIGGVERSGTAAIVGCSESENSGEVHTLYSYADAAAAFGGEDSLTALVRLMMQNGARRVLAVPVEESAQTGDYTAAFALLEREDEIKVVVCDSGETAVWKALRESVERASKEKRERIAVVGGGAVSETLLTQAKALGSERVVLAAPGGACAAAAVAGAICGQTDPAIPLGGAELLGIQSLDGDFSETELDALIQGGVTPVEMTAGRCQVVRGVTTRTESGGVKDAAWRELGTVLVIDDVIPAVRRTLQARFARSKNTAQVRGAIRSQVILLLEEKLAAEIITGYGDVSVEAVEDEGTVCLVTFSFTVAHGLNQIWLSAQITV